MVNPFDVLATEEEGAQRDVLDVFKFHSLVPDVKVEFKDSNFQTEKFKKFPCLLACSSKYGFFVTGSHQGFELGQTKLLRDTIYNAGNGDVVPFDKTISVKVKEGPVDILALTSDNLQLIVGVSGGIILTYNISDIIKNKEDTVPVQTQQLESDIMFIQPNPKEYPELIVLITQENDCKLIRYMTNEIVCTLPKITSVCWSPLGKQFICGTEDGLLEAYNTQGEKKDTIDRPPSQSDVSVGSVVWVESHVFLAIYKEDETKNTPYIVNRKLEDDERYKLLDEVNPIFSEYDTPDSHFYYSIIRDFGKEIKTLITLANTAANNLAIVGQSDDGSWATWIMGELSINLPLSTGDDYSDTYPVGLAIDFSASEPLPPYDSAESERPVSPMPVVFFMTNDGHICAYHAYNFELAKNDTKFDKMIEAHDVYTIPEPANFPKTPEATATVDAVNNSFSSVEDLPTKIPSFSRPSSIPKPSSSTSTSSSTTTPSSAFGFNAVNTTTSYEKIGFGKKSSSEETATIKSIENSAPKFGRTSSIGQAAAHAFGAKSSEHKNLFGSKPFDVDTLINKKPALEQAEQPHIKPTEVPEIPKKKEDNGCTLSFDSVKKDLDFDDSDNDSDISKVSGIDNSKDAFGLSTVSDALDGVESLENYEDEEFGDSPKSDDDDIVIVKEVKHSEETSDSDQLESENEEENVVTTDMNDSKATNDMGVDDQTNEKNDKVDEKEKSLAKDENIETEVARNSNEDNISPKKNSSDSISKDEKENDEPLTAEEKEAAEEKAKLEEEERIDKEKEEKRAEEERAAEEKRLEEEQVEKEKIDQEKRAAEEKRIEEERIAKEKRIEEERIAEEKRREKERIAEEKRREEERIAEEKRREEERIAEEKRREEERIAEEKRREEERIAEEKRREEERIAEEKRREEERIAEEKRREEARLAAMRTTPVLAKRERTGKPTVHERAVGIKGIAKEFEATYFNTIEELESTSLLLDDIEKDISIQAKTDFTSIKVSVLEDLDFEWIMDDMYDTENMAIDLNKAAESAKNDLLELYDYVSTLLDSVNNLKIEDIRSSLENKDSLDTLKSTVEEDAISQIILLENKLSTSKSTIEELEEKLNNYKQQLNTHKPNLIDESKLTTYTLRRTMREIERSISVQCKKLNYLEKEELVLTSKKSQPSDNSITTTNNIHASQKSNYQTHIQRKSFFDQMFLRSQQFNPLNV